MSSDSQNKPKKMAPGTPSTKPRGQRQPQTGPPEAKLEAAAKGATKLPQRQTRMPAARPDTTSTAASPNNSGSAAAPPPRHNHVVFTHKAHSEDNKCPSNILWEHLQTNDPKQLPEVHWFDSYDSLDKKLLNEYSKKRPTTRLAHLPIVFREENGIQHSVRLQAAVRDTISYLLDVEAEGNPVTAITNSPQGTSKLKPLWTGNLWLGGIKDSGNVRGVLSRHNISAVVSIHPTDWLTEESWKGLFQKWDETPDVISLQAEPNHSKRMQYQIELQDDSSSDLLAYFERAFWFMDQYLLQGKNVLVHCKMGQSRSASLVLGYMMYRYHKTHIAGSDSDKRPSTEKAVKDLQKLKRVLKDFPREFALLPDEPGETAPRSTTRKRKEVNTTKFKSQLLQYAQHLAEGGKNQPAKQPKPEEKKAGGGIIRDAVIVLCFMCDLKPTLEILDYWSSRKDMNRLAHYWIAASKDKALKEGIPVKDHLASFNEFFERNR